MSLLSTLLLSLASVSFVSAATADEWRSRSIYQVLTDRYALEDGSTTADCDASLGKYCGGTFKGIQNNLDYIQNLGFSAIWISPVTTNIASGTPFGDPYHGYWNKDLYSINSNFGTAAELKALSAALHARDMYLMVDVAPNHNGWDGAPSTVDYGVYYPFNSASDYHTNYCAVDYSDPSTFQDCWMGGLTVPLVDLKTESATVAAGYQTWIKQLVSNYSIDGLRIDTAMYIDTAFWPGFVEAAGVHMLAEVYNGDPSYSCGYQSYIPGILNFPTYYKAVAAFSSTSGSISDLAKVISQMQTKCGDVTVTGSFTENHDVERFAFLNDDFSQAKNLLSYAVLGDGIPIVYQGQEQHFAATGDGSDGSDPWNREALWSSEYNETSILASTVKSTNAIRTWAGKTDAGYYTNLTSVVAQETAYIALSRGTQDKAVLAVLTNGGTHQGSKSVSVTAPSFSSSTVLLDVMACSQSVTVGKGGSVKFSLAGGHPLVFYPQNLLAGSGICGH